MVLDLLLKRILQLDGVRLARPGEFSEQAFLNDKLDLAQAEAIADLIDATSEQAARSALKSLQGEFSNKVNQLVDSVIYLRTYVEASMKKLTFWQTVKSKQNYEKLLINLI